MSWLAWFYILVTPVSFSLLACWYWYTCRKIDQQYRDRQDDE